MWPLSVKEEANISYQLRKENRKSKRNGSREGLVREQIHANFKKNNNKEKKRIKRRKADLLRNLPVLELQSPSCQGVVMDRKKSFYENFTLEMVSFHRGDVCLQE